MSDSGRTMREECGHCHAIHGNDGTWYSCFEAAQRTVAALRAEVERLKARLVEQDAILDHWPDDERTCGELDCDQCMARFLAARHDNAKLKAEVETLRSIVTHFDKYEADLIEEKNTLRAEAERLKTCPGCGVVYDRANGGECKCGVERVRQTNTTLRSEVETLKGELERATTELSGGAVVFDTCAKQITALRTRLDALRKASEPCLAILQDKEIRPHMSPGVQDRMYAALAAALDAGLAVLGDQG